MIEINKKILDLDKGIHKANRFMWIALIVLFISGLLSAGTVFYAISKSNENIFVLDKEGDINPAYKTINNDNLEIEADNHIKMFYDTFFTYDKINVDLQVKRGLELGGKGLKDLWKVYRQQNYYNQIKQNNMIIKATVDSIKFDLRNSPYKARVYGKQKLQSGEIIENRHLNMDLTFVKTARVKGKNPHGLSIEYIFIKNQNVIEEKN